MISADNQQATPYQRESPQRLYAEYPKNGEITTQESILLGILYTDGCLSKKGRNSWRFYLGNTSFEIIEAFRLSMIAFFELNSHRVRVSQKVLNGKPYYKAVVDSSECGNFLTRKYGTFRTLAFKNRYGEKTFPPTKLPFNNNTRTIILTSFLKAAFSCDGGVNLYVGTQKDGYTFLIRNVYLSCAHPGLQLDYLNVLSILGIEAKLIQKDGKIIIRKKEELQKFKEKIGFLKGVKITQHSAFWQGWEKNRVLDLAISSYGNAKSIFKLPQFLG